MNFDLMLKVSIDGKRRLARIFKRHGRNPNSGNSRSRVCGEIEAVDHSTSPQCTLYRRTRQGFCLSFYAIPCSNGICNDDSEFAESGFYLMVCVLGVNLPFMPISLYEH